MWPHSQISPIFGRLMTNPATEMDPWTRFRRTGDRVVLGLAAWFLLAFIVVPSTIYVAHRTGVPLPGDFMAGRGTAPLSSYLEAWRLPADRITGFLLRISAFFLAISALAAYAVNTGRQVSQRPGRFAWSSPSWVVAALCALGVGSALVLQYWFPVAYAGLVMEDGFGEQASFFCWISVSILLAHSKSLRKKPAIIAFAVGSFVIAMEEISWGQRVIGLDTPSALDRFNYQGELTVHNLEAIRPLFQYQPYLISLAVLVGTFALPWAMKASPRFRGLMERVGIPQVPSYLWPAAVTVVVIVLTRMFVWGSEIDEAATALFAVSVALAIVFESSAKPRRAGARESLGLVALVILMLGGGLVAQRSDLQEQLISMATRKYPLEGMHEHAVKLFEYFDGRPEYDYPGFGIDYSEALSRAGRPDEAREVLERDLAKRVEKGSATAAEQRTIGEILIRLSREAEADSVLRAALELDRSTLARVEGTEREFAVRWSLARTHYLLGEQAHFEREVERALQTPSLRDRRYMEIWLRNVDPAQLD